MSSSKPGEGLYSAFWAKGAVPLFLFFLKTPSVSPALGIKPTTSPPLLKSIALLAEPNLLQLTHTFMPI